MRRSGRATALWLTLLLLVPGGQALRPMTQVTSLSPTASQSASTTDPGPQEPLVVRVDLDPNTHAWKAAAGPVASPTAEGDLSADLLGAYSLAVAAAPPACHLSMSLLAAIGQVESGSLAGHVLDVRHRVVPEILGPALDGGEFGRATDTDGGQMDGDKHWDRALGPMQLLPASWRVIGVDMDGDGVRDPQSIYDAAGAAMLYLCADGRDLAYAEQLRGALLDYNHADAYVEQVLAWKDEFDRRELAGRNLPTSVDLWSATVAQIGLRDHVGADASPSRTAADTKITVTAPAVSTKRGAEVPSQVDPPSGTDTLGAASTPTPAPSEVPVPSHALPPVVSSPTPPPPGPIVPGTPQLPAPDAESPVETTRSPTTPDEPAPSPALPSEPAPPCTPPPVGGAPDPLEPPEEAIVILGPCLTESPADAELSLPMAYR